MLSMINSVVAVPPNPLMTTCADLKAGFKANSCCAATMAEPVSISDGICPSLDELITYPAKFGVWTPCPAETYYLEYSADNPSAPGYKGCVSEDDAEPCGWYDYYDYDASTGTCSMTADLTTAIQTVRGGSPTMTADMLRLTGEESLPVITFPAIPMAYPVVRNNPDVPEMAELELVWKEFTSYMGSSLDLSGFRGYADYGAEQGMVATVAIKLTELASTTCNRNFYALLEAPAYGYDWSQAVRWANTKSSSFYEGTECTCYAAGTCKDGTVTISQNGWAPAVWASGSMPTQMGDDGIAYDPTSDSPNSPWLQTNVIPGNPIGRFNPCKTPQSRCLCDGVYWYPGFISAESELSDVKCYSWAFSITKIYSAQMRAGIFFVQDYEAAQTAASTIARTIFSIGNGLMSHMQVWGQIQLMRKIMEKPFSDPTSWLHAMALAQYEKWDIMDEGFDACKSAGVIQRATEQPKYFGAYIFSHMMTPLMGYSVDIGAASSDFFKSVVGYDHFNYNWGWRGEDPANYGIGTNITKYDFHRTHTFRAYEVYAEESRRMKLVCGNKDAKVTPSLLSVNEWIALRAADLGRRRRLNIKDFKGETTVDHYERALQIQKSVPRMLLVDALKHAMLTDSSKPTEYEHGMPADMHDVA